MFTYYAQDFRDVHSDRVVAGFYFEADANRFTEEYSSRHPGIWMVTRGLGGGSRNTYERGQRVELATAQTA